MIVLSLCDRTGNMVRPWVEAGFPAYCVDIQHEGDEVRDGVRYVGADIRHWIPPQEEYAAVFAFPPCTNLAVSGARWFKDKGLRGLIDGLELVERCRVICETIGAPWMLENPVSTLSTYWRKPDHMFDPCDFGGYLDPPGDHYTKRTCLWTGGGLRHAGTEARASTRGEQDAPVRAVTRPRRQAQRDAHGVRPCGVRGQHPQP